MPTQEIALRGGLDALRRDLDADGAGEVDHRLDDRVGGDVGVEVLHERAVDLDLVDRIFVQVAQRRIAGAEIVERDAHAGARAAC